MIVRGTSVRGRDHKKKMTNRLLYRSMTIALMLVLLLFIVYTFFTGKQIKANNNEYLISDTRQSAANIEYILNEGYSNIKILSQLVSESLNSPVVNIANYQSFIRDSVFDFIEFADKDGINHNITGNTSDASDRKYYLDAMQGNSGMEIIFDSRATHENLLMFYAPVYYSDSIIGSLIGVYQGEDKISRLLNDEYFGEKATSYLCTLDGKVFASSELVDAEKIDKIDDLLSESEKENIIKNSAEGKDHSFYLKRTGSLGYVKPFADNNWLLIRIYPASVNIRMMNEMFGAAFLMVVGLLLVFINNQRIVYYSDKRQESTINSQLTLLESITGIYYSIHLIDMSDYSIEEYETNELIRDVVRKGNNAADMLNSIIHTAVSEEFIEESIKFTDVYTLAERLREKKSIFLDVIDKNVGWLRLSFITREMGADGLPTKVILTTQIIDEDKKKEKELTYKANNDELTGLLNRRAYEDDILNYPDVPTEKDFVYASIDVNGLKNVNDNLGHAAGDELIKGTAQILKQAIGNYGRVYRTGGDEFVAMFFANEQYLSKILNDLRIIEGQWRGILVDELAISIGCASKREFPTETVEEIAKIADKRMYDDKAKYYSNKGIDRRGQTAAYTALCNLYAKILKVDLTTDTYSIIKMEASEKDIEKGFSDRISEWFLRFGRSGQVHEADIEEYFAKTDIAFLQDYFKSGKTSISVRYRRKHEDEFKEVIMELIPASDYSDEDQKVFLYVKCTDL